MEKVARDLVDAIKRTIPLDPEKRLSHTDAFQDSDAYNIILRVLKQCTQTI